MRRSLRPALFLSVLFLAVLVVSGSAGLISFLLLRAGYDLLVSGLLPIALFTLVVAVGGVLGVVTVGVQSSGRSQGDAGERSSKNKPQRGNDV